MKWAETVGLVQTRRLLLLLLFLLLLLLLFICLTTDHEVAGSSPGTSTNFKCGLGLERGPPSLVRTIGKLLD